MQNSSKFVLTSIHKTFILTFSHNKLQFKQQQKTTKHAATGTGVDCGSFKVYNNCLSDQILLENKKYIQIYNSYLFQAVGVADAKAGSSRFKA